MPKNWSSKRKNKNKIDFKFKIQIFRLLEMRMPRSSSFSVRDILDLPHMKSSSSPISATTTVTGDQPSAENCAANDAISDKAQNAAISNSDANFNERTKSPSDLTEAQRLQQSKLILRKTCFKRWQYCGKRLFPSLEYLGKSIKKRFKKFKFVSTKVWKLFECLVKGNKSALSSQ